jgi:hypothetical protein
MTVAKPARVLQEQALAVPHRLALIVSIVLVGMASFGFSTSAAAQDARAGVGFADGSSQPFLTSVAAEASFDGEGSRWFGPALSLCVRKGWSCLGVSSRFAFTLPGGRAEDEGASRISSELLFSASTDFELGQIVLTPSLGLGLGWRHREAIEESCTTASCVASDRVGLHSELRVMASLPLSRYAAASLVAGVGLVPFAWEINEADSDLGPAWLFRSALAVSFGL